MYGQRQFDGDVPSRRVGGEGRTTAQLVGHQRAHVDVVVVVVLTVLRAVDPIGHSGPLAIVACSLQAAGQSADGASSLNITHSTSEAYGIGGDYTFLSALVCQHDTVVFVASGVEVEGSEVNPCGASHLLVYRKLGLLSFVPHRVVGVVDAFGQGLIAHVDGIAPILGQLWLIGNEARL